MNTNKFSFKINCNINCFKCLPRKCRLSSCCREDDSDDSDSNSVSVSVNPPKSLNSSQKQLKDHVDREETDKKCIRVLDEIKISEA